MLVIPFVLIWNLCMAQEFRVYTVKGSVTVKKGNGQENVVPGMILNSSDVLTLSVDGRLVVLSETDKALHTIKNPSTDYLGTLMKKEGNTTQRLTESYLAFIKQKIADSGNPKDKNYKQSAGTSYRETDSMLLQVLVPESADTTRKKNMNTL